MGDEDTRVRAYYINSLSFALRKAAVPVYAGGYMDGKAQRRESRRNAIRRRKGRK